MNTLRWLRWWLSALVGMVSDAWEAMTKLEEFDRVIRAEIKRREREGWKGPDTNS